MANKTTGRQRKVVLASGVFDLLHLGHVRFLEAAKGAGGPNARLVVVVARDGTVEKRKGEKPVMPENQRCALVESLKVVDCAFLGFKDFNIGQAIEKIKPDAIAIGYDQEGVERLVRDYVERKGLSTRIVRIGEFGADELNSSSKIKQKIIKGFKK
ncbi:FAD synthase [Candidatus Bathyarchaeota archaeon]|nr:FAD synthase [Candidatus Bathyarchaeota archaeon]